jgi:hypothetical protein
MAGFATARRPISKHCVIFSRLAPAMRGRVYWSYQRSGLGLLHSGQLDCGCNGGSTAIGIDASIRHSRGMTTSAAFMLASLLGFEGAEPLAGVGYPLGVARSPWRRPAQGYPHPSQYASTRRSAEAKPSPPGPRRATHIQASTAVQDGVQRPSLCRPATHTEASTAVQEGVQRPSLCRRPAQGHPHRNSHCG